VLRKTLLETKNTELERNSVNLNPSTGASPCVLRLLADKGSVKFFQDLDFQTFQLILDLEKKYKNGTNN